MSIARRPNDDLFADTTMTFGEHLEELRGSLFKAVLSLFAGFLIGLYVGDWIVRAIEYPLVSALEDYYAKNAFGSIKSKIEERRKSGEAIPQELDDDANIEKLIYTDRLLFEEVFISPKDLRKAMREADAGQTPAAAGKTAKPAEKPVGQASSDRKNREQMSADQTGEVERQPASDTAAASASGEAQLSRIFLWHRMEDDDRLRIKSLSAQETFMIWLKAAFLAGAVLASPFIFYFIWSFVAAGLYPHEKHYVHVFLPFSLALFLAGVATAFVFVFKPVLSFFFSFNRSLGIDPDPRISEWLSFVLMMPLAFGISFQLPLVMLFLERIGIFDVHTYVSKWRISVLVIAVVSMVLSPGGDPYSMLLMMVPLVFLYFGGIALCRWKPSNRHESRGEEEARFQRGSK